ncbi:MAG: hypothetical protein P1U42_05810 [Phycisphaerales bacterium]|nr:hypothetical protein [Phycisphaerales bacterium]
MPELLYWILLIFVALPVYFFSGKWMFGNFAEFWKCVFYWLKPDWQSWMDGKFLEDVIAEFRIFIWIAICFGSTFGFHMLAQIVIA